MKMNLDTGAAANTFPWNFGPDGAGDGRFCRTASGEWILDGGAWQFQGCDGNGLLRSLSARLTGVHTKFCAALQRSRAEDDEIFIWEHDGGYMIRIHRKFCQGMRTHFEKLVNWLFSKTTFSIST